MLSLKGKVKHLSCVRRWICNRSHLGAGDSKSKAEGTLLVIRVWGEHLRTALFDQFAPAVSELWKMILPARFWNPFQHLRKTFPPHSCTLSSSKKCWCLRSGCISYERQHCFKSWYLNTLLEGFVTEPWLSVKTEVLLLVALFLAMWHLGL